MRVVLDTNILYDTVALEELAAMKDVQAVLPAVAFAERARQLQRAGRPIAELWHRLEKSRIVVESFGAEEALRHDLGRVTDKAWAGLARDAFIAGHVGPGDILWTKDVEDFVKVGVPREQIHPI